MKFGIRSLLLATFAIGFLVHVGEYLYGSSGRGGVELSRLLMVFVMGACSVVTFPVLVSGIFGKNGVIGGALLGALMWATLLSAVRVYDDGAFGYVWIQVMLLLSTTAATIFVYFRSQTAETEDAHSVETLLFQYRQRNSDAGEDNRVRRE